MTFPISVRIDDWVKRLSTSKAQPGGVARYIANSHKFRKKVEAHVHKELSAAVQEVLRVAEQPRPGEGGRSTGSPQSKMSFCMTRFDAIVKPLMEIWRILKSLFAALTEEESEGGEKAKWATEILDRNLAYEPLVSLGLALDIFVAGKDWTHSRDQRRRGVFGSICRSKRLNDAFLGHLHSLIEAEKPLALAKGYTMGYARQVIDLLEKQMVVRGGSRDRLVQWPAAWGDRMKPIANARVLVSWIRKYILALWPSAGLQEALSPLDLSTRQAADFQAANVDEEHDYLMKTIAPLADARKVKTEDVVAGYQRVRSLAVEVHRRGCATIIESWQQAAKERDASKNYSSFAKYLYPACAQFMGNGELEGDFSKFVSVDLFSKDFHADVKRAIAKVRVDGHHPRDFDQLQDPSSDIVKWVQRVQSMCTKLFGKRDLTKEEKKRNESVFVDPRKGVPRVTFRRGIAQHARKRKAQLAELASLPASSRRRQCVLGEAPSVAEQQRLARWPQEILEQDATKKAKFDSLTVDSATYGAQLQADRAEGLDAALLKNLREKKRAEERHREVRASISVTNPATAYAKGLRIGFSVELLYACEASEEQRKMLNKLSVTFTTRQEKAFRTKQPRHGAVFARLVLVRNLGHFLASPRDMLGWHVRLFGAGVVDDLWMDTTSKYCSKGDSLPPPMVRFVGLRTPTHCLIHPSFQEESKSVYEALEKTAAILPSAFSTWTVTTMTLSKNDKKDNISIHMPTAAGKRRILLCGVGAKDEVRRMLNRAEQEKKASEHPGEGHPASSSSASAPTAKPCPQRSAVRVWDAEALWEDISRPGPAISRAIAVSPGDAARSK